MYSSGNLIPIPIPKRPRSKADSNSIGPSRRVEGFFFRFAHVSGSCCSGKINRSTWSGCQLLLAKFMNRECQLAGLVYFLQLKELIDPIPELNILLTERSGCFLLNLKNQSSKDTKLHWEGYLLYTCPFC